MQYYTYYIYNIHYIHYIHFISYEYHTYYIPVAAHPIGRYHTAITSAARNR
jgi:hypothetical protein